MSTSKSYPARSLQYLGNIRDTDHLSKLNGSPASDAHNNNHHNNISSDNTHNNNTNISNNMMVVDLACRRVRPRGSAARGAAHRDVAFLKARYVCLTVRKALPRGWTCRRALPMSVVVVGTR